MASNPIIPLEAGKQYRGFLLDLQSTGVALLPPEHELVLNIETGHYFVINWDVRYPVTDGVFSPAELTLMLALLNAWPSYVENGRLLQAVTNRPMEEIMQVLDIGGDEALEPLHRLVDTCRPRLIAFGIDIIAVSNQGYKLGRHKKTEGA